ncbi:MAG: Nitrite and sulphite reductase 4Fe-4S region [Methanoculleus marisnigri]|jgi:NAD(P)H-nitrite reductase|uniref:Nitrite and sulphite reductase 4Fe-4S region n=1 Tax=Methanoculleus marisnigri TaxID=2198 RepID=A0A117MFJ5_9EURY|nr:MAG: Nitrite and sulphite reductase 4Fe-4S region [Methanoculleus marisnigri]KUL01260.1 MAG: Nitrite and sulphite reductase 4Fe-4S region [Methanoculleus marisnigri]
MENGPRGAILQRDGTSYAIVPRTPAGIVSPEHLESIIKVVRRYDIPVIKMTSGQRMVFVGIKEEDVDSIWNELGMTVGQATAPCVHYVQACPGTVTCKYGKQDSLSLGLEVENLYLDMNLPAKVKMGISGCPRCCGESYLRDIGIVGNAKGWTVIFGGNSGGRPRIGDVAAKDLTKEQALDLVRRLLEYYRENAKPGERTARFVERVGFDAVRKDVLTFAPYMPLDSARSG